MGSASRCLFSGRGAGGSRWPRGLGAFVVVTRRGKSLRMPMCWGCGWLSALDPRGLSSWAFVVVTRRGESQRMPICGGCGLPSALAPGGLSSWAFVVVTRRGKSQRMPICWGRAGCHPRWAWGVERLGVCCCDTPWGIATNADLLGQGGLPSALGLGVEQLGVCCCVLSRVRLSGRTVYRSPEGGTDHGRPHLFLLRKKTRIVLSVLAGEMVLLRLPPAGEGVEQSIGR